MRVRLVPSVRRPTAPLLGPVLVHGVLVGLLLLLIVAAAQGPTFALVAIGAACAVLVLAFLGSTRAGILVLVGAYFTAPMYKGLAPSPESLITPTDLLLVVGFALLLPQLMRGRAGLPPLFLGGLVLLVVAGLVASTFSSDRLTSFLALTLWVSVMLGLPLAIRLWGPGGRTIDLLVVAYVAGQIFSLLAGYVQGNEGQGRQAGLSTHPNLLAQCGMLSLALLFYLVHRYQQRWQVLLVLVAAAACGASVLVSGSRAATLVVAVLVLLVPVAERSAWMGFVVAAAVALFIAALPAIVEWAGPGSSISRLTGEGGVSNSDSARSIGLEEGVDRFFADPLRGSGLVDLFDIHNNFLEILVGTGVFGLAGYLLVMWSLARPLFGQSEFRRLCYVTWAYLAFGATVPSLYDRSVWVLVALSAVAMTATTTAATTAATATGPAAAARPPRTPLPTPPEPPAPPPSRERVRSA